ncbi:MAG: BMP family ABC transporter substrate-binding protein [Acidimicrobiia bacterium]|nr:MAG: BMP family ABC transporter substrate-binding protein [Acidimicrobiia bacterium]
MKTRRPLGLLALIAALALVAAACTSSDDTTTTTAAPAGGGDATTTTAAPAGGGGDATTTTAAMEELTFGMILVGPENDRGWSQAHREAGQYLEQQLGATMILLDKVNPADRPETTVEQVVDEMIAQGAQLIFATSDDMKDGIEAAAAAHPDVPMIWSSGDSAWEDGQAYRGDLANLGNIMGEMEFGKQIAGCAAALSSETGSIAYLGPLINDETRRLVNSVFLGASYCWENVMGNDPADFEFEVNWIGFWFNIPGVTLDPTEVVNNFYDGGADVVISGIDTTEAIVRAGQRAGAGETVWAIPYDFELACDEAPEICLGVPYFNWGPSYVETAQSVIDGTYSAEFRWLGPDPSDINNPATSMIGWFDGDGLSSDNAGALATFIAGLLDGSIDLYVGPLNNQDGTTYLTDGEVATDQQVWYTKQLLEGIEGPSE